MKDNVLVVGSVLSALVFGILFPFGMFLKPFLLIMIGAIMFLNFLNFKIRLVDIKIKYTLYWFVVNILFLSVFAFFIGSVLIKELWIGLVLITLAPSAIMSSVFVGLTGGDKEGALYHTAIITFLSPVIMPFMLFILFREIIEISYINIFVSLLSLIFIPFILSRIVLKLKISNITSKTYRKPISVLLFLILWHLVSSATYQLSIISMENIFLSFFLIFMITSFAYSIGYFIEGGGKTLPFVIGQRNVAIMVGAVASGFSPLVSIPIILNIPIQQFLNTLLLYKYRKQ